jgi:hypothetical protein
MADEDGEVRRLVAAPHSLPVGQVVGVWGIFLLCVTLSTPGSDSISVYD